MLAVRRTKLERCLALTKEQKYLADADHDSQITTGSLPARSVCRLYLPTRPTKVGIALTCHLPDQA